MNARPLARTVVLLAALVATARAALAADAAAEAPPAVGPLPIGTEAQLFIDDYVVQSTANLVRRINPLAKHEANPVIRPDQPWEEGYATPISAFFDADENLYRMWYRPGRNKFNLGYITSRDGVAWDKPALGQVDFQGSKANSHLAVKTGPAWNGVIKDDRDPDPKRRYKLLSYNRATDSNGLYLHVSPDGLNWKPHSDKPLLEGLADCHTLMGWDPKIERYVAYVRPDKAIRVIARTTSPNLVEWTPWQVVLAPDEDDPPGTQFYGMSVFPDRGVYFGLLWVYHPNTLLVDVQLAFSRDGIHWQRAARRHPLLMLGLPDRFDSGCIIPLQPILSGDELKIFYFTYDRPHPVVYPNEAVPTLTTPLPRDQQKWLEGRRGWGGLAIAKRDRFVSLDAESKPGEVITKPFRFEGAGLAVNAKADRGEVKVEILDEAGKPIPGFRAAEAVGVRADGIALPMSWRGKADPATLRGKTVQLRIIAQSARLYSFQVTE
jgi:hypothetical protein